MNPLRLLLVLVVSAASALSQVLFDELALVRPRRSYDVLHYALTLNFDEPNREVSGISEITLTPLDRPIDSLRLDAVDMTVSSVRLNGEPLRFSNNSPWLTVLLNTSCQLSDTLTIAIVYSCNPKDGLFFIQPDSGHLNRRWQIWSQGEEMLNRFWFPCYDYPDDKATSEVIATVRDQYELLSNGRLIREVHNVGERTRTFHWSQEAPHSSYLIMVAAGEYSILRDEYRGIPISHYVYPEDVEKGRRGFRKTAAILEFMEKATGHPYPWEKYSHIILDDFMWGGMENTSAVTLNEAYIFDERAAIDFHADDVIAHEAAHQWWGDLVTCADWSHLWLNEGFANYFEALYKREDRGNDEYEYEAYQWLRGILRVEKSTGRKPIVSTNGYTVNLYSKGAWVLRMLANHLGEKELLEAIRHYAEKHKYESVTTDDFRIAVEEATGEDLNWFFDQWVFGAGTPVINVVPDWNPDGTILRLTVTQTQDTDSLTDIFRFPLEMEFDGPSGRSVQRVWIDKREETFTFPLDEKPAMVLIDPNQQILKTLDFPRTNAEYMFQLENAENVSHRLDAIDALGEFCGESDVFLALREATLHDPFWAVRSEAGEVLAESGNDRTKEVLYEMYADPDSRVRDSAIEGLKHFASVDAADFVEHAAQTDSSYRVLAASIKTMVDVDSARAFDLAVSHLGMESYRDMIRLASLEALRNLGNPRAVPEVIPCTNPHYAPGTRRRAVEALQSCGVSDGKAREKVLQLLNDFNPSVRIASIRCLENWGGNENLSAIEERKEVEEEGDVLEAIGKAIGRMTE